ncbi:uncharacterized protein C8orf74 homolog [Nothoprocta perdicaria]|uniref:uncharacterized protein C8orf74 homolog n=1 Tax=Nothoprocta perdicaria TaxID=30464 RepID=UPI000E1BEDCB|nr:uncharacterized protein C8orf74 homolog [Nothoprocta perdicaria]
MVLLSPVAVRAVVQLQREEGRQLLRELLGWEPFDEVWDLQQSIRLDILYNSIMFAARKGLSWAAVATVGKIAEELLEEMKGLTISQALKVFHEKISACEPKLRPLKPGILCDYFLNTYFKHFHLYQFLLCHKRTVQQSYATLEVCVPPHPLPLEAGVEVEVEKHQQQIAALSAAETQKRTDVLHLQKMLKAEKDIKLEKVYKKVEDPSEKLDKERLESLVEEVIRAEAETTREIFQAEIQATFEILELRLQKKMLSLKPPVSNLPPLVPDVRTKKTPKPRERKKKK